MIRSRDTSAAVACESQPVQIEGEHWAGDGLLSEHGVEHRHNAVDRDSWISHPEDAVKLGCNECDSWLRRGFSKGLILCRDVTNLQVKSNQILQCVQPNTKQFQEVKLLMAQ